MLIKDIMTKNPICVEEGTSISEAKAIMDGRNISKLPVLNSSKKLIGIITKKDIVKASPSDATTLDKYEIEALLGKLTCGKIMTKKVVTVDESEVVEEAARILVDQKIGCLPVVNGDIVVGIVTESDLFALFTNMFGARYQGVRANFVMTDQPGVLVGVLNKIADAKGNLVSVITRESEVAGTRRVTIKVTGIDIKKIEKILVDASANVMDVRVI